MRMAGAFDLPLGKTTPPCCTTQRGEYARALVVPIGPERTNDDDKSIPISSDTGGAEEPRRLQPSATVNAAVASSRCSQLSRCQIHCETCQLY